jgi:catechol 2,3-dioxygenase-like lactoylglutathione lyase family enzyme
MKRQALLVLCGACHAARPPVSVAALDLSVDDVGRETRFYVDGLGFVATAPGQVALGTEHVAFATGSGRAAPPDSRANDLWFEHMAIVVSDMDAAVARVGRLGIRPISDGPQTLPATNPAAGGIRAFYFRDADGHSLELIWYPPGKGDPRWQDYGGRLFLGIDHTAIAVADTERSLRFYRDLLGLDVNGGSLNEGVEQERLSGVPGARVRITGLRGAGGPGVELLEYLAPRDGRPAPADTRPGDRWYWEIVVVVAQGTRARLAAAGVPLDGDVVTDPDGHHVRISEVDR